MISAELDPWRIDLGGHLLNADGDDRRLLALKREIIGMSFCCFLSKKLRTVHAKQSTEMAGSGLMQIEPVFLNELK